MNDYKFDGLTLRDILSEALDGEPLMLEETILYLQEVYGINYPRAQESLEGHDRSTDEEPGPEPLVENKKSIENDK